MTRKYAVLALFLALLVPVQAAQPAEITKQTITLEGNDRIFYIYVPDSIKAADAPLLLLLHGSGSDGNYIAQLWKDKADKEGVILLAPDAMNKDGWRLAKDSPNVIHDFIAAVEAKYPVDRHRVYLFGQSGGAVYALILAMLESEYFAAMSIHASSWRHESEFNAMKYATRKIPLAIIIGDQDEFFSLSSIRNTEAALKQAGFPIEVTVIEGQHHWYSDKIAPDVNNRAWDFLKDKALANVPKFAVYK